MSKPIIVLDFDGVIHSYKSGWKGINDIPDLPVDGVKVFIKELRENYQVYILSSRSALPHGVYAIEEWLKKYGIKVDKIVAHKPPAFITIDDRCICFKGSFDGLLEQIKSFKSWTNKGNI